VYDDPEAESAYLRAAAWAKSVKGTPYGVTTPVLAIEPTGKPPAPLDPRVMAELLNRGKP
jgi:hypothetical protein